MIDFSTKEKVNEKLNGYNPNKIGNIGEAIVALQLHDVFRERIASINNSGNNVDLTIKLKDEEEPITIEVKSSAFKKDDYRNHWSDGVAINTKLFLHKF